MKLEKLLYIIEMIFLTIFVISLILVLTNALNVWLIIIISFPIFIISFLIRRIINMKNRK